MTEVAVHPEQQYLRLLALCLHTGDRRVDRTGVGCRSLFGHQLRYDLRQGFPLVTTKALNVRAIVQELLWMLRGSTNVRNLNVRNLNAAGVHIWDAWADERGDLGPIYGAQWRDWPAYGSSIGFDQLAEAIRLLRTDPASRRMLVSAWNVAELDEMALPPCHFAFQFHVATPGRLSCLVSMRSADVFLGLPFNIAGYALLTSMVAEVTGLEPHELIFSLGDVHLYDNHADQAQAQLARAPTWPLPRLELAPSAEIDAFSADDIRILGYAPQARIPAPIAV
ncbi:MAG: thymidylate synthase [Proteobacteria bacterium]|nr:thymidylate synthase [Pseudomonadota bacterium]